MKIDRFCSQPPQHFPVMKWGPILLIFIQFLPISSITEYHRFAKGQSSAAWAEKCCPARCKAGQVVPGRCWQWVPLRLNLRSCPCEIQCLTEKASREWNFFTGPEVHYADYADARCKLRTARKAEKWDLMVRSFSQRRLVPEEWAQCCQRCIHSHQRSTTQQHDWRWNQCACLHASKAPEWLATWAEYHTAVDPCLGNCVRCTGFRKKPHQI